MAITFALPDGRNLSKAAISTTRDYRFITGTYNESDTVSLQVSIRGKAFSTDPDLISFSDGGFIVPNPEAYPDGLALYSGSNEVKLQSTNLKGMIADQGQLDLILVKETVAASLPLAPTGIKAESYRGFTRITLEAVSDTENLIGYNFYAALSSGGGDEGYSQINVDPVSVPTVNRYEQPLAEMDVDLVVARDEDGNLLKNPQVLHVVAEQADLGTQEIIKREIDEVMVITDDMDKLRLQMQVQQYYRTETYSFDHDRKASEINSPRTVTNNFFASMPDEEPLYYVVTSLYLNDGVETESPYSVEVEARPMTVMAEKGNFPVVTKDDMLQKMAVDIYRANPSISFQPGTVIRDVVVDPVLNEAQRIRLVVDFLHRASSLHTLLEIDDPNRVGESISAPESPYKSALASALHLSSSVAVQPIIDGCFDKLAANYGVVRRIGSKARGEVTFFVRELDKTYQIPLGTRVSGGSVFLTTSSTAMNFENAAAYYNPTTKRYSVTVGVVALNAGSSGNVNSGAISSTPLAGLSVSNAAPTFGGADGESNAVLANRALVRIASVDTGTKRGYYQAVAGISGVLEAFCVGAGDDLMRRDFDETYGKHLGGKVDVWIRGEKTTKISDTFAFTFETKQNVQFELVHLDSLTFRALDNTLSLENPIVEMLDYQTPKLGLMNASTGEYFDLTDIEIVDYNIIRLSIDLPQPAVDFSDVILGDYRYRTGSSYVFARQPVTEIESLVGTVTGELSAATYTLTRANPPTTTGFSRKAEDFVKIIAPTDPNSDAVVPTGDLIEVVDESHVLVGEHLEYLANLGGINLTVRVTSEDGATEYRGPYHPSGIYDYTLIEGDQTTPLAIKRVEGRDIEDGQTVMVSYKHDENFTIKYRSNLIISTTQDTIDDMKHLAADVLIKEAIPVTIDLTATVIAKRGYTPSEVDAAIRISLETLFAGLNMGDPVRQSDIVEAIDSSDGVSYVILPLTKMALGDASYVVQESLASNQVGDHSLLLRWSNNKTNVFLIQEELNHNTTAGGGSDQGNYRMVEKDGFKLDVLDSAPHLLGASPHQAFIIGQGGLPIPQYSDNETIRSQGYVTEDEIATRRKELTANRVLVSLPVGESPLDSEFRVTYGVSNDRGAMDLECGPTSYFVLGEVTLSFDEDRANATRLSSSVSRSY
ncbi:MAG: baseplate J/gp47 family protein [Planctomycetota bacterium]|nr:baseplate J/gp47 family protein [Planctomycetota bacterium]